MRLSRRQLFVAGAGALAIPVQAFAAQRPSLLVYDSRLPASRAFARGFATQRIDLAKEHLRLWRGLRSALPRGQVEGLTGWSDFVAVRGLLEERGLRVRLEAKSGRLFRWTMA